MTEALPQSEWPSTLACTTCGVEVDFKQQPGWHWRNRGTGDRSTVRLRILVTCSNGHALEAWLDMERDKPPPKWLRGGAYGW